MNTCNARLIWARIFTSVILFAFVFSLSGNSANAQEGAQEPGRDVYLLSPALPDPQNIEVPTGFLDEEQMQRLVDSLLVKQSIALRQALQSLRQRGLISDFKPVEGGLYRLTGGAENIRVHLEGLVEIGALQEVKGETPACMLNYQDMANSIIKDIIWVRQLQKSQSNIVRIQPAELKINIYMNEWSGYEYVFGTGAPPSSELKLSIIHNNIEVGSSYTFSNPDGSYAFDFEWHPCRGYPAWFATPGDIVKVTGGGVTSETVMTYINGFADASTNLITGTTSPNRSIQVEVSQMNRAAPCDSGLTFQVISSANSSGAYSVNTTSVIDFDRSASVTVASVDTNGHATVTNATVARLKYYPWGFGRVTYIPNKQYSVSLKRSSTVIETLNGVIDYDGINYIYFTNNVYDGDQVIFISDDFQMTYTVIAPSVAFDPDTGKISGLAHSIIAIVGEIDIERSPVPTRCGGNKCVSATPGAFDYYELYVGQHYRGEYVTVNYYTQEGENFGYTLSDPSAIAANITWDSVDIYWQEPFDGDMVVTLKDSEGVYKDSSIAYENLYSAYGYYGYFSEEIVAGDTIEVTAGGITETMIVQILTQPRLNFNTDRLSVLTHSSGRLISEVRGEEDIYCMEVGSPGAYDFVIGRDVKAGEEALVNLSGPDGHYTYANAYSLAMYLDLSDAFVYGNVETPGALLTWTHMRELEVKGSGTATLYWPDYFEFSFSEPPLPGDVLEIVTNDGNFHSLVIPTITANLDPVGRQIFGQAPAYSQVDVTVYRATTDYSYGLQIFPYSSGAGEYSATLPTELYWSFDCSVADLTHPCIGFSAWTDDSDHFNFAIYDRPEPAAPDEYEADNAYTVASTYTTVQQHSLHSEDDEDWIKFTVTTEDVLAGRAFNFASTQLGWNMDLYIELFGSDGVTLIDSDYRENSDGSGIGPRIEKKFSSAGEYYLRIHSKPTEVDADNDGGYCDSVYTIFREEYVYLPLVRR